LYPLVCKIPLLAIEMTLTEHDMTMMCWTYGALQRAHINSCSKADDDEAVSRSLNDTMANDTVA
jgi:hypothetical protein